MSNAQSARVSDLTQQLREEGAFFGVSKKPVRIGDQVVAGKVGLAREDDGRPLGIVSRGYRVLTNEEAWSHFGRALAKSKIDLAGAKATAKLAHAGARTLITVTFPSHQVVVAKGDASEFSIVLRNSYDGRWKYSATGGALRLACLNGMLLMDPVAAFSGYHTRKLNVEAAAQRVTAILDEFSRSGKEWTKLLSTPITDEQAWRVFCLYANRPADFKRGLAAYRDEDGRATLARKIMERYELHEKKELGPNAYAAMNVLTHHATHATERDGREAISADLRQRKVREVIESKYWVDRVVGGKK